MTVKNLVVYFAILFGHGFTQDDQDTSIFEELSSEEDDMLLEGEKRMSEDILTILNHFKEPGAIGIPGVDIPDPYRVPDMKQSVTFFTTIHFKNTAVYGISKFRVVRISADIAGNNMEVQISFIIDKIQAQGNYTVSIWTDVSGPFIVDVTGVQVNAKATLGVERDGKLRAQAIVIDLALSTIAVDLKNLGLIGNMLQGVINSVGPFLFESIKPYILNEAHLKARAMINTNLERYIGNTDFPNSISPWDMLIADFRKKVQNMGNDPYEIEDYVDTVSIFSIKLSETCITGISSFRRLGNISLEMMNQTVLLEFSIGIQKLEGMTQWHISAVSDLISTSGIASFSIEYINGTIILAQSLDTKRRPEFKKLDLKMGNVHVRYNGAGTLDYVIESALNVLPNLLKHHIMNIIEGQLKDEIQHELNAIDVEELIKCELPKVYRKAVGLNYSTVIDTQKIEESCDEDEFFNF